MYIIGKQKCYISNIDFEEGKVEFTDDRYDALEYPDSWKPSVELDMVKNYFYDMYEEQLTDMEVIGV